MATNQEVIKAFTRYETARAGNLSTHDGMLFSYGKPIASMLGFIAHVGMFTAKHEAFVSATTSHHVMATIRGAASEGYRVEKMNPNEAEYIFSVLCRK